MPGERGRVDRSTSNSVRMASQQSRMAWLSISGNRPAQTRRTAVIRLVSAMAADRRLETVGWRSEGSSVSSSGLRSPASSLCSAATLAEVRPSAPRSTKLISPSVALRTTLRGPVKVRPLTSTCWLSLTTSNSSTPAPTDACHGKPLRAEVTTSRAAGVSRETRPVATSCPSSTRTASVWPTPESGSWPKRIGRDCDGIDSPARSMTTECRQPATRIGVPV
jgi:hypothetical protein